MRLSPGLRLLLSAVLLIVTVAVVTKAGPPGGQPIVWEEAESLEGRPVLGLESAPVQIVLFSDFRCPHCRAFHLEELPRLEREVIEPGLARLVFVHAPFLGERSFELARAAACAHWQGNAAFWAYQRALFEQGRAVPKGRVGAWLVRMAARADIDEERLATCLDDGRSDGAVLADRAMAERLGLRGVPTVLVDGRQVGTDAATVERAVRHAASDKR